MIGIDTIFTYRPRLTRVQLPQKSRLKLSHLYTCGLFRIGLNYESNRAEAALVRTMESLNGSSWFTQKPCCPNCEMRLSVPAGDTRSIAAADDSCSDEQLTSSTISSSAVVIPTATVHRRNERERERVR